MPSRRSILTAGTVSFITASTGCAAVLDRSSAEPALRDVTLRNTDDEPHRLALRLFHDGEKILDRTYELGPPTVDGEDAETVDGATDHLASVEDAWDSPTGKFTAVVRVDDGKRFEFRLDDGIHPPAPYRYEIRIEDDGGVSTWFAELDPSTTTPT